MGKTPEDAATLYEDVPPWMAEPLWDWLEQRTVRRIGNPGGSTGRVTVSNVEFVKKFDRITHSYSPLAPEFAQFGAEAFEQLDIDTLLRFIDYCVATAEPFIDLVSNSELEVILKESNFAWKVGTRDGYPGLERRLPLGVQESADHVMATSGDAGRRLSEAWHAAFGVSPNPLLAYHLAVLAVEDAVLPVVSPKDRDRTLGKAIAVIRDQGWVLPTPKPDDRAPTGDVLQLTLGMLWHGHGERHGGAMDPDTKITQEAAAAAVMLAVPLVQWFTSGAARRSS